MGILDKIRGKFAKPKDKLEVQEKPDDSGVIKHQEAVAGKVESVYRMTSKNLLAREEREVLLVILKKRFEAKNKHYISADGIVWEDVQKRLDANPETLWSLNEMERTGGEPDVVEFDRKTGECIFIDCSRESPLGRRNCVYDKEAEEYLRKNYPTVKWDGNAISTAALMGVDILSQKEYRELQTKGEFDRHSVSWLKTPIDKRRAGGALSGDRRQDGVYVSVHDVDFHSGIRAWRGGLRV